MNDKRILPKSISEEIYERFFELIGESELFLSDSVEQLRELQKKNELTKPSAIENILNSNGGER